MTKPQIPNNKTTIYIDESGTLPDPNDKVVIVAAVGTKIPGGLTKVTKSTRKYLRARRAKTDEIKFYKAGEKTKIKFLQELVKNKVEIFTLAVNKHGQKIDDTPKNFALLSWLLLKDCLAFYGNTVDKIVFDRHFHKPGDEAEFNKTLLEFLDEELIIEHVDSAKDKRVNSADMVAGSVLWEKTGKSDKFYQIIKGSIVIEKTIDWKNARRLLMKEKSR